MMLSQTTKKIVYGTLFVLAVCALAYLLYVLFFREAAPVSQAPLVNQNTNTALPNINGLPNVNGANTNTDGDPQDPTTGLPQIDTVASGGLTNAVSITPDIDTTAPQPGNDGSLRYYDSESGQFFRVGVDGTITQIGDAQFPNVETVTWAKASDQAILEFPDGNNIFYDFNSRDQVTLPKEYADFTFSPNADSIGFKYLHEDEERRVLATSRPDGSSAQTLESLGRYEDRVTVDWSPTGSVVAHYAEYIDLNRQQIGFVGLNKENFKGIVISGNGLQTQYSPDGTRLLYSTYSSATENQHVLSIVDADGENIGNNNQTFSLRTSADKCGFSPDGAMAYCGVPTENVFGSGITPALLDDVPDDIYSVNLTTGVTKKIATPVNENGEALYRVTELFVTPGGGEIVFQDGNSGELITIDLS